MKKIIFIYMNINVIFNVLKCEKNFWSIYYNYVKNNKMQYTILTILIEPKITN